MEITRRIEKCSYVIELNEHEFKRLKDTLMKGKNWMQDIQYRTQDTKPFTGELTELAELLTKLDDFKS